MNGTRWFILCILPILGACEQVPITTKGTPPATAAPTARAAATAAFVGGETVTWDALRPALVERAGGQVLTEHVLGLQVQRRLAEHGITLTQEQIDAEWPLMLRTLHDDPNQAQRMLNELRERQGIGDHRYLAMMRRNAGMRRLVQDDVQITDKLLRRAYERLHGPTFECRLIVVDSAAEAGDIVRRHRAGESFIDLAIRRSTDESRTQGGWVGSINPADPTWPLALRQALPAVPAGQSSQPIALASGFAIVRVENKSEGGIAAFDDVKDDLTRRVRLNEQRRLMQQLARALLEQADVTALDAALKSAYDQHNNIP